MKKSIRPKSEDLIYRRYRMILKKPHLSCKEIDGMRLSLKMLARDKNLLFRGRREFPLQPLNLPV
jgi:hypothetical protein